MRATLLYIWVSFSWLALIPLQAIAGSKTTEARKAQQSLCELFMYESFPVSEGDRRLFNASQFGPVLSGSIKATPEYIEKWQNMTGKKHAFPWHVYFVGNKKEGVMDSPSKTIKGLRKRLNAILEKRMAMNEVSYPMQIFFFTGRIKVLLPNFFGDWIPNLNSKPEESSFAFPNLLSGLRLEIDGRQYQYDFDRNSSVIFITAGTELVPSDWQDSFSIAHEMAHTTQFSNNSRYFSFFYEARADFYGYATSGSEPEGPLMGGGIRSPLADKGKSLDVYFKEFNPVATHHDLGSLISPIYWQTYGRLKEMGKESLMKGYFSRMESLLTSPNSSPWVKVHPGGGIEYAKYERLRLKEARAIFNFLASISMQWSVEESLPREFTEWIGKRWEEAGARGPFLRYRATRANSDGEVFITHGEKSRDIVDLPEAWTSVQDLMEYLRRNDE